MTARVETRNVMPGPRGVGMNRSRRISETSELNPTDAALVIAASAGDRRAQGALFELHAGMAFNLGRRLLPYRVDVDDLVQDSIFYALRVLTSLKNPNAFPGWFATIVMRTAAQRYRQHLRTGRPGSSVDVDSLPSRVASPDQVLELHELRVVLAAFPAAERSALLLRRVDGCRHEEIARKLGISLATTRRRLRSAEARLSRATRRAAPPRISTTVARGDVSA